MEGVPNGECVKSLRPRLTQQRRDAAYRADQSAATGHANSWSAHLSVAFAVKRPRANSNRAIAVCFPNHKHLFKRPTQAVRPNACGYFFAKAGLR